MNDTYVEVLVARKKNPMLGVARVLLYVLAAICLFLGLFGSAVFLIGTIIFAVLIFAVLPRLDIEYEYLYLDKEITIDKIMSKEKRKRAYTVDLNRMEFMATSNSHELDSYRARNLKVHDFTSAEENAKVYTIVYTSAEEGTVLVNIEPNGEMLHAIKTVFPRKVIDI